MSLYLSRSEILSLKEEISREFQDLVTHRWFSARGDSLQWRFFKHCFGILMGDVNDHFPCSKAKATQYKYEISDKLNKYYFLFGKPVKYMFSLVHKKDVVESGYEDPSYPSNNAYFLMVSENQMNPDSAHLKRMLAEKTVADAIDAEWQAYRSLPDIDLSSLDGVFDPEGGAYKRVCLIARGNHKRGWTLRQENNPSTKRLIRVKIQEMSDARAEVRTLEYWFLNWWSQRNQEYEHTYRELNRQSYYLIWRDNRWLIVDNIYPPPRLSTPGRNLRRLPRE